MSTGSLTGLSAGLSSAVEALGRQQQGNDSQTKAAGAARDFEALLLGQILKSSHGDSGWLGADDDDACSAAIGFSEEQLANSMASSGGLGLAKLIRSGIASQQEAIDSASKP